MLVVNACLQTLLSPDFFVNENTFLGQPTSAVFSAYLCGLSDSFGPKSQSLHSNSDVKESFSRELHN